ncbi:small ubiquitin-related modifier 2-like [Primulina huaijiensis]|uniref:small ubiquitin-related modifier 2-like n=1 Tax=Primulina huaijiensis TaxID=1492673 RepID=UPI003CC6FA8E
MEENGSWEMAEEAHLRYVRLKIKCNKDGIERFYMFNRNSRMKKLLLDYCRLTSISFLSTRFVINHRAFLIDKTPNQLGLDDNDQIDALIDGNGA